MPINPYTKKEWPITKLCNPFYQHKLSQSRVEGEVNLISLKLSKGKSKTWRR